MLPNGSSYVGPTWDHGTLLANLKLYLLLYLFLRIRVEVSLLEKYFPLKAVLIQTISQDPPWGM